ncbi:NADPH-dependent FMN reductase [[Clostridium] ultunense Esp]|jgi:multimeric flavodoxin WrbA|uniref:NADPH-dependent FMN reductase n=1 Tax=[Clostridium] ultunense Esp TaxID=1288971 RepID=M1YZ77_9FIRM|nr:MULTISPECIES: NAD(P)H-dependent oxidoreductase [Bacillota]MCF6462009.1 NADPH-dependent oxidoreductase [Clostridium sp. Cult1]NMA72787.1 NAD(P)H-dependent oxidoreductase [Bacteroidales bacterium]CCQ95890.1 NADPH-dependent FMN reductase [[Clostridium] ultunense Esp]SHD78001.1 NADPH-dependent FMN reductase [[Clostridium] ultunense Esp]
MRIVVLHGQLHKGSTYNITKLFLDNLSDENTEIIEYFMPKDTPSFCIGCFNCFTKGEEQCPHAEVVQPIVKAIEEADLLVLESPCYVYGMSGQLKTLLDHLAYLWMPHRPHPKMFSKVGLVISTAAGAGTKKVTKALKDNLFYWGVAKIYRYGKNVAASSWETVKPEKKRQIEKEVIKLASRISKQIGKTKPGIKTKAIFQVMRMSQKINDWNPTDREYWLQKGWLDSSKPW